MTEAELLDKIRSLDAELKNEAINFIDNLIRKKSSLAKKIHPKAGFLKKNTFIIKDGFNDIPDSFREYIV